MKIFNEKNFARMGAFLSVLVLTALGPNMLYSSSATDSATSRVLLQGGDVETLVSLVQEVGGTVTEELHVLKAVDTELTQDQLIAISRSADVHRIILDVQASVDTSGMTGQREFGNIWKFDQGATVEGDRNYGNIWKFDQGTTVESDRDYGNIWKLEQGEDAEGDRDYGNIWK